MVVVGMAGWLGSFGSEVVVVIAFIWWMVKGNEGKEKQQQPSQQHDEGRGAQVWAARFMIEWFSSVN
jgi:hypothetical protein